MTESRNVLCVTHTCSAWKSKTNNILDWKECSFILQFGCGNCWHCMHLSPGLSDKHKYFFALPVLCTCSANNTAHLTTAALSTWQLGSKYNPFKAAVQTLPFPVWHPSHGNYNGSMLIQHVVCSIKHWKNTTICRDTVFHRCPCSQTAEKYHMWTASECGVSLHHTCAISQVGLKQSHSLWVLCIHTKLELSSNIGFNGGSDWICRFYN